MPSGYYFHPPSHPSRAAVLDVGLKCVHSCKFCYYSFLDGSDDQFAGMRRAAFRPGEQLQQTLAELSASGFLAFDITGGEPALHPDIIDLVRTGAELGMSPRLITLGQFLMRRHRRGTRDRLVDDLLEAGLVDMLFSCHATEEHLFHSLTGGSWAELSRAMEHLDGLGFDYCTNTTVVEANYRHLPELARELLRHNVYMHNFIAMNAYHGWSEKGRSLGMQAGYAVIAPYLREAVAILEEGGVAVNVRYAPMCTVAGLERNLVGVAGVRYDPHEWMNTVDHRADSPAGDGRRIPLVPGQPDRGYHFATAEGQLKGLTLVGARGDSETQTLTKVFPAACVHCSAMQVCDGIALPYVRERGQGEFTPYSGAERGTLLDRERLAYRPAFLVKRRADAPMRRVVRRALRPEPLRPAPRVSVIVTCYNYGRYLREALDCALAQTWANLEVVLVDDGSTDDTPAIALEYAQRFPGRLVSISQANSGQPAHARNAGISRSTGDLILCLDADDAIAPSLVEECVGWMRRHPEASIVYPATRIFGERNELPVTPDYDYAHLVMGNFIPYCALYRREVWEEVGGYRTNVRGCEDWDFWIAAGGLGHVGLHLPRVLFRYRVHGEGLYATDVQRNAEARYRQIVLNNADLYPPGMVRAARRGETVVRAID